VPNPAHHLSGDFHIHTNQMLSSVGDNCFTFSGIGLYSQELFKTAPKNSTKLAPLLRSAMSKQRVTGQLFTDFWMDIGTPQRLQILENRLASSLV
jgi:MurNAc alpha-1-phosphate uridylyltransferase